MDHAVDALQPFYEVNLRLVAEEYESKKYKSIEDCPTFKELKAITEAMNSLHRYLGWEEINIYEELSITFDKKGLSVRIPLQNIKFEDSYEQFKLEKLESTDLTKAIDCIEGLLMEKVLTISFH
jgi:hypothetical protein